MVLYFAGTKERTYKKNERSQTEVYVTYLVNPAIQFPQKKQVKKTGITQGDNGL